MIWILIAGSFVAAVVLAVTIPAALAYLIAWLILRRMKPKD